MSLYINTGKRDCDMIENEIHKLPVASIEEVQTTSGLMAQKHKAIVVSGQVVSILTKKYRLVQHKEAFAPIINSVKNNVDKFNFCIIADNQRAYLDILTEKANDGKEGIEFGFRCKNTFDGRSSIKFSFVQQKASRWVELVEKNHVTVWGYRQSCKNGMVMKIPLAYEKVVVPEERAKIEELLRLSKNIAHFNPTVENGLKEVKNVIEILFLLRKPVERIIALADKYSLLGAQKEDIIKLISKYCGKKMSHSIYDKFARDNEENTSLWGLYNAITSLATHRQDLSNNTRQKLYEHAGDMLEAEIIVSAS